ncbi:MAG: rod shape-determining protein MreD [Paracoccaceae bacterium]
MVDPLTTRRLTYWAMFFAISAFVIFLRILPLDITPGGWPGPDWTIAIAFAWVLRRPDYVPVLLFAAIVLLNDMIFLRAPGLWAGLSVIGFEFLRSRTQITREMPFMFEWAMVTAVLLAMILANRLILAIFVVGQPSLRMDALLIVATSAAYPMIVIVSALALGMKKIAPGSVDRLGHPL